MSGDGLKRPLRSRLYVPPEPVDFTKWRPQLPWSAWPGRSLRITNTKRGMRVEVVPTPKPKETK